MTKIKGFCVSWDEAEEILKNILDNSGIEIIRDDEMPELYKAQSDTQNLDTSEVDERFSQYFKHEVIGYAYEDGINFIFR